MKTRMYILIIAIVLAVNFNFTCYRDKPTPYAYNLIPDSLLFPYELGDTVIFRSVNTDKVVYDTFIIEKRIGKGISLQSSVDPYGGSREVADNEEISLIYNNPSKKFIVTEARYSRIAYIKRFLKLWMSYNGQCQCASSSDFSSYIMINDFILNGEVFKDVVYTEQCGYCFYDIYRNVHNGLLSYKTKDNKVFNFYLHKPFQCGISKNGEL